MATITEHTITLTGSKTEEQQTVKDALFQFLQDNDWVVEPRLKEGRKTNQQRIVYIKCPYMAECFYDTYKPFLLSQEMDDLLNSSCRGVKVELCITDGTDVVNKNGDPALNGHENLFIIFRLSRQYRGQYAKQEVRTYNYHPS